VIGNSIGVGALALLPMIGLADRIRIEERAPAEAPGDAYRSFASTRRRMLPFIG
jgi:protein-S-isoprenylcysteine O-methyltransferase Ste14